MKELFNHRVDWLASMIFILLSFFICLSSIIPVSASPIIFFQNYYTGISATRIHDEFARSIWEESDRTGGLKRVLSKDKIWSESESTLAIVRVAAKEGLAIESSVTKIMGKSYKAVDEVTAVIKNNELLKKLEAVSKGNWVKVYEAGEKDGKKIEVHYFRNNNTGQAFSVKQKYDYWHQKAFKKIGK